MPSFDLYKRMYGTNVGQGHKVQSDMIMEATWDRDLQSKTAYLFDYYHDPSPKVLRGMKIGKDMIPLDMKFVKHTYQTMAKDAITYHMLMKPSQECNVPYYKEYEEMYGMEWPIGLYVLIPNEKGRLDRWLVVDAADSEDVQFPTYELLKCDYTVQYIMDGIKMNVAAVNRSQNSYNSGVWTD